MLPRLVKIGLWWLAVGNVVDFFVTWWGVSSGLVEEANPFIQSMLSASPVLAGVVKIGAALIAIAVFAWAYPRNPKYTGAGIALTSLGLAVILVHHAMWVHAWLWLFTG